MSDEVRTEEIQMAKVYMRWTRFQPDRREYQQNSTEFVPDGVKVLVEVPNTTEYVDSYNEDDSPNLTVRGMASVMMQLENAILPKVQSEDFERAFVGEPDDDWNDVKDGETKKEKKVTEKEESSDEGEGDSWEDGDEPEEEEDDWEETINTKSKKTKTKKTDDSNWEEEWDK